MKKCLLLLALSLLSLSAIAQTDYCHNIKKEVDDMKGYIEYTGESKHMNVYKIITHDQSVMKLHIHIGGKTGDYAGKGVYVKFDDGTVLKWETQKLEVSYHGSVFGEDPYLFQAIVLIDDDNIKDFTTKRIVKVQLNDTSKEIKDNESEKIKEYVKCLEAKKK